MHPVRVTTLTAISVPHPGAFLEALTLDPDQQTRSGYMIDFMRPGHEHILLSGDQPAGNARPPAHLVGRRLVPGWVRRPRHGGVRQRPYHLEVLRGISHWVPEQAPGRTADVVPRRLAEN